MHFTYAESVQAGSNNFLVINVFETTKETVGAARAMLPPLTVYNLTIMLAAMKLTL
jgi:hypothetical protein